MHELAICAVNVIIACLPVLKRRLVLQSSPFPEWRHPQWRFQPCLGGCGCNFGPTPKQRAQLKPSTAQNICILQTLSTTAQTIGPDVPSGVGHHCQRGYGFRDRISPFCLPEWLGPCSLVISAWGPKSKEVTSVWLHSEIFIWITCMCLTINPAPLGLLQ